MTETSRPFGTTTLSTTSPTDRITMATVATRAKQLLSHKNAFGFAAEECFAADLTNLPTNEQYVLRMMVRNPANPTLTLPAELEWLRDLIERCNEHQQAMDIHQPYVYVTVRHGIVKSITDDLWHVDGFSMRVPHIPEQNYIIATNQATEVLEQQIVLPEDFDPFRHNIHQYFQDVANASMVTTPNDSVVYLIDPYVVHRRPAVTVNTWRTFVRISFIPIEIEDDTCTINPLIPRIKPYGRADLQPAALSNHLTAAKEHVKPVIVPIAQMDRASRS